MTPTLAGRIQTRIFLLVVIGVPWTLLIGWALPRPEGATVGDAYRVLLAAVAVVIVVGILWELVYHGLQQYRWERDWPTLFGLVTIVNEGITTYLVLRLLGFDVDVAAFLIQFITLWLLVWLAANGPMRVVFIRWRFRGGRIW